MGRRTLAAAAAAVAASVAGGAAFSTIRASSLQLGASAAPQLVESRLSVVGAQATKPAISNKLCDTPGLCAGAVALVMSLAAAVHHRASSGRVAMQSQGQGGRNNLGQFFMPKVKGAKKMALFRPRKNYGSHGARKVPRRYELYDILEEIDETTPTYTVISEPEEPMQPVMDVPLTERYPWAGSLEKVPQAKRDLEEDTETALEPYFQSWADAPPPQGRSQLYVHRRGWPTYNYPPWINKQEYGKGHYIPKSLPFKKDRRPEKWQMNKFQPSCCTLSCPMLARVAAGCRLLGLALVVGVCPVRTADITFHHRDSTDAPVHIYWVKPGRQRWPPVALEATSPDVVERVRCRIGRRKHASENHAQDSDSAADAIARLRSDLEVRGEFVITVRKDWAPLGSERFLTLVKRGFFDGCCLFRAVRGFLVQFGVSSNPELHNEFGNARIPDDPLRQELLPLPNGVLAFAGNGDNSRTSQLWISLGPGVAGRSAWETPVGYVAPHEGLDVVETITTEYGDLPSFGGHAPEQSIMQQSVKGVEYLRTEYPNIDYFESCAVVEKGSIAVGDVQPPPDEELVEVGAIPPGHSSTQNSHIGHMFVAKLGGPDGRVLGRYKVTRDGQQVDLLPVAEL